MRELRGYVELLDKNDVKDLFEALSLCIEYIRMDLYIYNTGKNDAFDFDDQFPVIIEIAGIPMYLTEVYVKKNDFRIVLLDYDDMTLGDYDNTGENEQVAYFINYCLNQDKDGKE